MEINFRGIAIAQNFTLREWAAQIWSGATKAMA
jgi:hypothetical protein